MSNRLAGIDCPKCGAPLATDGRALWCTFVANGRNLGDGRNGIYAGPCDYGIAERVPLAALASPGDAAATGAG